MCIYGLEILTLRLGVLGGPGGAGLLLGGAGLLGGQIPAQRGADSFPSPSSSWLGVKG